MTPRRSPASDRQELDAQDVVVAGADGVQLRLGRRAVDVDPGDGRLRALHGDPRPVRSMPDMLALDADYRQRFGGSRLRPITMRTVVPAILSGAVFVLAALLLLSTLR